MQMSGEGRGGLGVLKSSVTARAEAVRYRGQAALGFVQCGSKEIRVLPCCMCYRGSRTNSLVILARRMPTGGLKVGLE